MRSAGCFATAFDRYFRFFRSMSFFACLGFYAFAGAPAAQAGQSSTKRCVPQTPASLVASEGPLAQFQRAFTASPHLNESAPNAEVAPAGEMQSNDLTELRKSLENAARRGNSQAQVNLAVASLAGWGAPPNAGAALYWLHAAADRKYPLAFYDLGILYMNGCGVRQDYKEAFHLFEKAARAGDSAAQVNLGYFYDQGLGVARDSVAAAFWYDKAAEAGVAVAQYNLADLYLRGEGVNQDDAKAFRLFGQAAEQGHSRARVMLGSMYATGRGTSKDLVAAYMWLVASEMENDPRCGYQLRMIEQELSPGQVAEARERAKSLGSPRNSSDDTALLR
jgi:Sel1 repeat